MARDAIYGRRKLFPQIEQSIIASVQGSTSWSVEDLVVGNDLVKERNWSTGRH
ncbi:hypothetical protein WN944_014094 [Citrus x changshan-huyou]|uniref:Uncharacterized protein n=1 Tax=Citrus x changshan-huyou TaxID=2935761 RepID=A0AAP0M545_9ROSI